MKIPVAGFDPSMRNWGLASGLLDLDTGYLEELTLRVIQTSPSNIKTVRKSSQDLVSATFTLTTLMPWIQDAKVIFTEMPIGSQSAMAMKGYGTCIGLLAAVQAGGKTLIQVSPEEVKLALAGTPNATKEAMINAAYAAYPYTNWPIHGGKITAGKAEHMADAIGAIHAGVLTPEFQQVMSILKGIK